MNQERDLNLYIAFDISASNNFGFKLSKKDAGIELAASLMFSALNNNDNVGLALFTDKIEKFIKPKKGKKHALKILRDLIYYKAKSKNTDINSSLSYLNKIIKKRSIIFIISDFISSDFEKPLKILKKKHDVILVNLNDAREQNIPDIGYIYLEDEETGEQMLVNTSDSSFRKHYCILMAKRNNELLNKSKKLRIDLIQFNTNEEFGVILKKFFKLREKRMIR